VEEAGAEIASTNRGGLVAFRGFDPVARVF